MTISSIVSSVMSGCQEGISGIQHAYKAGAGALHEMAPHLFDWDARLAIPIQSVSVDEVNTEKKALDAY